MSSISCTITPIRYTIAPIGCTIGFNSCTIAFNHFAKKFLRKKSRSEEIVNPGGSEISQKPLYQGI